MDKKKALVRGVKMCRVADRASSLWEKKDRHGKGSRRDTESGYAGLTTPTRDSPAISVQQATV